jgi:hypothetical protein
MLNLTLSPLLLLLSAAVGGIYSLIDHFRFAHRPVGYFPPRRGPSVALIVLAVIGVVGFGLVAGFLYLLSQVPRSC